jgi:gliding motility-associated-like protein
VIGTQFKTVFATGIYIATGITTQGCSSTDTMTVVNTWALPLVTLDKNAELCAGTTRTVTAGSFSSYLWQDGSTSSTFTIRDVGNYWVQVTDDNNCVGSDTTEVTTILPLPGAFLPRDTAICSYGTLTLRPLQTFSSYLWSSNSSSPTILIDKPGDYSLTVRDKKGCLGRDTITVTPKQCLTGVHIPTAFSPNGDHRNDIFKAIVVGRTKEFELTVYNRWGQIVFHSTDPGKGWDGKLGSLEQQTNVFVWLCTYQLENETKRMERGTVTLIQ